MHQHRHARSTSPRQDPTRHTTHKRQHNAPHRHTLTERPVYIVPQPATPLRLILTAGHMCWNRDLSRHAMTRSPRHTSESAPATMLRTCAPRRPRTLQRAPTNCTRARATGAPRPQSATDTASSVSAEPILDVVDWRRKRIHSAPASCARATAADATHALVGRSRAQCDACATTRCSARPHTHAIERGREQAGPREEAQLRSAARGVFSARRHRAQLLFDCTRRKCGLPSEGEGGGEGEGEDEGEG
jgi:hypothetical protein